MKYDLLLMRMFSKDNPLTKEELDFVNKRAARQKLISWLYVEHYNLNKKEGKPEIVDFHVSLGDDAEKHSVFDTVKGLLNMKATISETLDFGD